MQSLQKILPECFIFLSLQMFFHLTIMENKKGEKLLTFHPNKFIIRLKCY